MNNIGVENFLDISKRIEEIVWEYDVTYLEAALMLAERLDMEEENIGTIIQNNPVLLEKISKEAEALNFIKKENRLDFDDECIPSVPRLHSS